MATKRELFDALTVHLSFTESTTEFMYGWKVKSRSKEEFEEAVDRLYCNIAASVKRGYAYGATGRRVTGAADIMRVEALRAIRSL